MGFDATVMLFAESDELPDQSESSDNLFFPSGAEKIQQAQRNNETQDACVNEVLQAYLKSSSDELEHKQLRCSREKF